MNASECKRQAMNYVRFPAGFDRYGELDAIVAGWMKPYAERDSSVDAGVVLADEVDPETLEHRTVERVLHKPRLVRPFLFGPAEVLDLANHLRRELRLR